uniref:Uncharacterized protein n=1 Tax=Arundo donax TaxID=35708 RepID=A0A0A8YP70_ARUDO
MLSNVINNSFSTMSHQVIQNNQTLVNMPPIFTSVIDPLPHNIHDHLVLMIVLGCLSNVSQERSMWAPWLVACCIKNLLFYSGHLEDLLIHLSFYVPDRLIEHFLHGSLSNLSSLLRPALCSPPRLETRGGRQAGGADRRGAPRGDARRRESKGIPLDGGRRGMGGEAVAVVRRSRALPLAFLFLLPS